jgi:protoporphyrinogen/coproporphyrinogen III oxidase
MPRVVIVGGGIAGLAAARALAGSPAAPRVTVVEASDRLGGKLRTDRVDGFLVEAGADSFGTRPPGRETGGGALELVEELGLAGQVVPTPPKRVLVLRRGRLEELPRGLQLVVPTDLGEVFRSRLLSLPGKLRVAMELARRPPRGARRGGAAGETVAAFLRRHFGREYTDRIAGPLLAGIHSADLERLSLRAAFPMLAGLEARWGSLVRGARRAGAGGGPSRVTLAGGMGTLVDALAADLSGAGVALVTRRRVRAISRDPEGQRHRIEVDDDVTILADAVILTPPPAVSAALWAAGSRSGDGDALAAGLRAIPHASTATVSLGFDRGRVRHPLDALGFLVPPSEGRPLSACTFASSKFPGRAPEGAVLVRAYLAGDLPEEDDALAALAASELSGVLGITAEPRIARVHRFRDANPRYEPGHRRRVAELEAAAPPGLAVAGCAYHGVGIPDCIASGRRAAERVLTHLGDGS